MLRWLVAGLLVAHGLVHIAVWASSKVAEGQGSTPDRSWVLGTQHSLVIGLTYVVVACSRPPPARSCSRWRGGRR